MLQLHNLKPKNRKKSRKRVGRGSGSGTGTYSGRGMKGQKSRSGGNIRPGFEGGRMPLIRQLPKKRGTRSLKPDAQPVVVSRLERVLEDGDTVDAALLAKKGLADRRFPVKIVDGGKLKKKFIIKNVPISKKAEQAIIEAGGKVINV